MKKTGVSAKMIGWMGILIWGCFATAQAAPVLDRITVALAPVLEKLDPKAGVGANERTLMVSYQAQPFKVPDRSMTGEVSEKVHDEIGPGPKGFVLRVDIQPKGTVNQAETPQTLQEKFWKTDLEVTPVAGTQVQIYWVLSYGAETDLQLLAKIRTILTEGKF